MLLNCACRLVVRSRSAAATAGACSASAPAKGRRYRVGDLRRAGQEPRVGQRQQKLRVVARHAFALGGIGQLGQLANLVAHSEAKIPERMQHRLDEALFLGADPSLHDDQQFDVRVEAQPPAAISPMAQTATRAAVWLSGLVDNLGDEASMRSDIGRERAPPPWPSLVSAANSLRAASSDSASRARRSQTRRSPVSVMDIDEKLLVINRPVAVPDGERPGRGS